MVYNTFCASRSVTSLGRAPPVYAYFTKIWKRDSPQIKLKKHMRFTKCDQCVLSTEALDVERRKGGHGYLSPDMQKIKITLSEHHKVNMARGVERVTGVSVRYSLRSSSLWVWAGCTEW